MSFVTKQTYLEVFTLCLAGLCGALGVVLAATAAHIKSEPGLRNASEMLLFHAPAAIGIASWGANHALSKFWFNASAIVMLFGACLFSGDLTIRAFLNLTIFHYAAPLGGLLIIAGWILLFVAALARLRQSQDL